MSWFVVPACACLTAVGSCLAVGGVSHPAGCAPQLSCGTRSGAGLCRRRRDSPCRSRPHAWYRPGSGTVCSRYVGARRVSGRSLKGTRRGAPVVRVARAGGDDDRGEQSGQERRCVQRASRPGWKAHGASRNGLSGRGPGRPRTGGDVAVDQGGKRQSQTRLASRSQLCGGRAGDSSRGELSPCRRGASRLERSRRCGLGPWFPSGRHGGSWSSGREAWPGRPLTWR